MVHKSSRIPWSSIAIATAAEIYFQLARMEAAGIPAQQMFGLLQTSPKIVRRLQQLQTDLKRGKSIAESGLSAGIFRNADKDLLITGESSGKIGEIYQHLADFYGKKAKRQRNIKAKLYLPAVVFMLAVFIQPLPVLISGKMSAWVYFLTGFGFLTKTALILFIGCKLPYWLTEGCLRFLGLGRWVYQLQVKLPVISSWLISRQCNDFLRSLGLMLHAGMALSDALPKAVNCIRNPLLRKQFLPLKASVSNGLSVSGAVTGIRVMEPQIIKWIASGEKSGKLSETLLHITKMATEKINLQEDMLAEWLPRVCYFVVTGWLAAGMIAGASASIVNGG